MLPLTPFTRRVHSQVPTAPGYKETGPEQDRLSKWRLVAYYLLGCPNLHQSEDFNRMQTIHMKFLKMMEVLSYVFCGTGLQLGKLLTDLAHKIVLVQLEEQRNLNLGIE